ncbi:metallophosphoesterase [Clostridium sp. NSJ-49]|uniref:metallophosphoesterase n=1 Tax=Clostridium TaxID=1485 RepID=UPI00164A4499|nr:MULTISPECIES: metallophosphoesterase [unclassified Clostridium]MBC5627082.1 metallophosphoesterase [Clostridium sp. NSJ-49]MCD2500310.1 metallophosphoesterase [Clostridium sp. NSJ-145]MDU6341032.1 metallophosphoesterase [Clostridium sp.]
MKNKLDYLYDNAFTIPFDDSSKLVFISDVHRGDGTYFDSLLPNANIYITALKYYLRNGYTYIEVGDGDELWKNKNFNEIAYTYEEVFKIFNKYKKKDNIYIIYGNHDIIKRNKKFKDIQENALKKIGADYGREFLKFIEDIEFYPGLNMLYTPLNEKFLVTHGNQMDFGNNELWFVSRFLVRYIWKFLFGIAGFRDPSSSAKNKTRRTRVDLELQNWARDNGKMLLCGHTHNSRFPGEFEPPYFNDGCCILPYAMTSIEVEGGDIALIKWSVDAQDSGVLWVKRKIIGGPRKISTFLSWAKEERLRVNRENNKKKR